MTALTVTPDAPVTESKAKIRKAPGTGAVPVGNTRALTADEIADQIDAQKEEGALEQAEVVKVRRAVEKGAAEMGKNMLVLRTARNWMNDPKGIEHGCNTFKAYCESVLLTSEADASRKIMHYQVSQVLPASLMPSQESHTRELASVPTEKWVQVMTDAQNMAVNLKKNIDDVPKVTAQLIKAAAEPFIPEDKKPKPRLTSGAKTPKATPANAVAASENTATALPTPEKLEDEVIPGWTLSEIPVYLGKRPLEVEGYADLFKLVFQYPEKDGQPEYTKEVVCFIPSTSGKKSEAVPATEEKEDASDETDEDNTHEGSTEGLAG